VKSGELANRPMSLSISDAIIEQNRVVTANLRLVDLTTESKETGSSMVVENTRRVSK